MRRSTASNNPAKHLRIVTTGALIATVVIIAANVYVSKASSLPPGGAVPGGRCGVAGGVGALSLADGVVPTGTTAFDEHLPGVMRLGQDLLAALREATMGAAEEGILLYINSGWRSPKHQDRLLCDAIETYGSGAEAARWVATAQTSLHVSGDAVDVGPSHAAAWLSEHGATYRLCRVYRNEPWHFELFPEAASDGCPHMYPDPTSDPRLRP